MESCTHCGHVDEARHIDPPRLCETSSTDPCALCGEVGHLNIKITQEEETLQYLLHQREKMMLEYNRAHPSIFDRLPVEAISAVFSYYVSTFSGGQELPFVLGAVSRKWRQIAWATSGVWSSFIVDVRKYASYMSQTRLQLAKDWLSRSGRLPLSITVQVEDSFKNSTLWLSEFHPLIDAISQYSNRWHRLHLKLPSALIGRFNFSNIQYLHEINLYSLDGDDLTFHALFQNLPRIVKTRYLDLNPRYLNWQHVTRFTARLLPVHHVLEILRLGHNLRECVFQSVFIRRVDLPNDAYYPVTNSWLESLEINLEFDDFEGRFFNNVTLPYLYHLSVYSLRARLYPNPLISFLIRSRSGLRSLEFFEEDFTPQDSIRILQATPHLEKLKIPNAFAIRSQHPFYCSLSNHLPAHDNLVPSFVEPLLLSLRIFDWTGRGLFHWEAIPRFLVPLSHYNHPRRRPLEIVKIFCECEEDDPVPYIGEDILWQLSHFIDHVQFQFEVKVGNSPVGDLWKMSLEKIYEQKRLKLT
ncbi:hypothetical protein CPB84DRAFT_258524 [Gymnopilus junonius]|uniref:F-box domain-containing protein n=1 Tax=Gymnopilus junonius TaxID=109634 RepID=A0A9P5NDY8_GYMJU|nr:hypothetical protein CPB84DRAFT_258524 [Gymnopilus junonius]